MVCVLFLHSVTSPGASFTVRPALATALVAADISTGGITNDCYLNICNVVMVPDLWILFSRKRDGSRMSENYRCNVSHYHTIRRDLSTHARTRGSWGQATMVPLSDCSVTIQLLAHSPLSPALKLLSRRPFPSLVTVSALRALSHHLADTRLLQRLPQQPPGNTAQAAGGPMGVHLQP